MRDAEEIELDLDGIRLAARRFGAPDAKPVLALHGWLDNAATFDALAPLLADTHGIVALDLPGHGRSDRRPPGIRYHFVDYLDDVRAALDRLGWTEAILLGHSLGAAIASVFAAACPERVDALWLIEGLGPLTVAPEGALAQLRSALDQPVASQSAPRVHAEIASAVRARMRAGGLSERAAASLVGRGLDKTDGGWTWSSDPRLLLPSPQRYTEAEIVQMLGGIRAPTLLVSAAPSPAIVAPEAMQARVDAIADIEVVAIEGNHHVHLESAGAVADAILAFEARRAARNQRGG